jgi:hypothetical protein|tara:strand:- start:137 stop:343 length:207 start_codon:yes stop_codon:yes gene_type:complete
MEAYNCSAYGAGAYGTCTEQSVGAPNTGFFQQLVDSGSFTILAPLIVAIIVVTIASIMITLRKKAHKS